MKRCLVLPLCGTAGAVLLLTAGGCQRPPEDTAETELILESHEAVEWPGPPTTVRLVLQLEGDRFRVVSATPKRGSSRPPSLAGNREALLEGRVRLVEYVTKDRAGAVLATGSFLVPQVAVAEFQDLSVETRVRRREEPLARPVVKVSIPFDSRIATVAFEGLEPGAEVEPAKWKRVSMGQVTLETRDDSRQGEETNHEPVE